MRTGCQLGSPRLAPVLGYLIPLLFLCTKISNTTLNLQGFDAHLEPNKLPLQTLRPNSDFPGLRGHFLYIVQISYVPLPFKLENASTAHHPPRFQFNA
ncbi:hypothetical protein PCASD_20883 [Puccinia coronata f. sp. avenae]|uniref:Uncharacterized protein n=1 Tax=Puccinia coronata f. sp. avenae TaxID=200324 RepID=A0A2N5S185_9BASI|nr:hypothetical protein PCASD_24547 [Puccinia coronata f. sp. avenae]PLW26581.1 hypothetical protein PCASD_20883 [Puccinia coronata f. sp. avenae]